MNEIIELAVMKALKRGIEATVKRLLDPNLTLHELKNAWTVLKLDMELIEVEIVKEIHGERKWEKLNL